jgi:thiamine biosynthesis protein ThiI
MPPYLVIHYSEIGLKGRNRAFFERQLQHNIHERLSGLEVTAIERLSGRLLVTLGPGADSVIAAERLRTVPGIAYIALAYSTPKDIGALAAGVLRALRQSPSLKGVPVLCDLRSEQAQEGGDGQSPAAYSFKVDTNRADKHFPLTSPQISAEIGDRVQTATGWRVDLTHPDLVIHVEMLFEEAYFYMDRVPGIGGLPVGASGTVGLLMSGGIDSPVAGYYALKRGCQVIPIHFHSGPFGDWMSSQEKVKRLVTALRPYGILGKYYVVPIGEIQREIVVDTPASMRIVLYRRLMVRIAEELIGREDGLALVTGESLGQVASQTLHSLRAVEAVATLPILRPLIGLDKIEIIAQAKTMGTYEISIEAGDDCCQFLMPRQVVTRPALADVEAAEANLDVARLVKTGLAGARAEWA